MKAAAAIILALIGLGLGIKAANDWYRSSQISPTEPAWPLSPDAPVDRNIMGHVAGMQITLRNVARLNRAAALWTAAAILASTLSSVVSAWPSN